MCLPMEAAVSLPNGGASGCAYPWWLECPSLMGVHQDVPTHSGQNIPPSVGGT